jgi:hypothetical protein
MLRQITQGLTLFPTESSVQRVRRGPRGEQMRAHEIEETSAQIGVETLSPLSLCGGLEAMNPDSSCCWKKRKA